MNNSDLKREMLRHTLATLAYRGAKAVGDAPDSFAHFQVSETTRTPIQILAHISDLLDWALSICKRRRDLPHLNAGVIESGNRTLSHSADEPR